MNLRARLLAAFCFIMIVPLVVLGVIASGNAAKIVHDEVENVTFTLTEEMEKALSYQFESYEKSLAVLSHDSNLDEASYNAMAKDRLLKVFEGYGKEFPDVQNIYIGYANKEFIIYPAVDLPADYDPTTRPWYQDAMNANELIWTDPYPNATDDSTVITAAIPVFSKYSNKMVGVLAADINLKTMSDELAQIKVGETGSAAIVSAQGVTLLHPDPEMVGKEVPVPELAESLATKESDIVSYELNGAKKMAIFQTMPKTGWKIVITLNQSEIAAKATPIRNTIALVGLISVAIAMVIAWLFANSLTRPIRNISDLMDQVKNGNFRVSSDYKSKDEIGHLSESFNIMISNVATLINNTQVAVNEVKISAENLRENAEQASISSEEVAKTVTEIAEGATEQAMDAEKGTRIASELDSQFVMLTDISSVMGNEAQQAIEKNEAGVKVVKSLRDKTIENNEASHKVSDAINELETKSNAIGSIVDTISAISEQTNLLALNASIEAARAGEHGRGFAVVADEIRKLAEESNNAAVEIKNIIGDIQEQSRSTVVIMSDMTNRSNEQAEVVTEVDDAFMSINQSIDEITGKIGEITTTIEMLSNSKDKMLEAIEGISAVSEETAAASEEVSASMQEQSATVEEVSHSAEQLNQLAEELQKQVAKFDV
ncbi:MAG: methyl-accepting chemotaxis protein [Clostridia bacterium]|nr:methyl-accepting chemotaxis protein [Clostridia bacterium]